MSIIGTILVWIINIYLLVLLARMIISFVPMISPDFQPRGFWLVLFEAVYTLTDPPVRWLDRRLPDVRIGQVGLSLGFPLVWLALLLLRTVVVMVFFG